MARSRSPRLTPTISKVLCKSLTRASDCWIRAELPPDWPVVEGVSALLSEVQCLRIGVLRPFTLAQFAEVECEASDDPQVITDSWRNKSVEDRRANPTIVLGEAHGEEEAGLRAVPQIVTEKDVLEIWKEELEDWLREHIHSDTPIPLFNQLFDFTLNAIVDAVQLDEYVASTLRRPGQALANLRADCGCLTYSPTSGF